QPELGDAMACVEGTLGRAILAQGIACYLNDEQRAPWMRVPPRSLFVADHSEIRLRYAEFPELQGELDPQQVLGRELRKNQPTEHLDDTGVQHALRRHAAENSVDEFQALALGEDARVHHVHVL